MSAERTIRGPEVEAMLREVAGEVKEMSPGIWSFSLANGRVLGATARERSGWMLLSADSSEDGTGDGSWDLLCRNADLGGLAKFVLPAAGSRAHLQAEFPLDGYKSSRGHLERACRSFLEGPTRPAVEAPRERGTVEKPLSELCTEAGWPFTEKKAESGRVELESRGDFHQALVERRNGEIQARVELMGVGGFEEISRRALAVFLLRGSGLVRFARAATREAGTEARVGFEVRLEQDSGASELSHALGALSIACRICGREVGELENAEVARGYLLLQGHSLSPSRTSEETKGRRTRATRNDKEE